MQRIKKLFIILMAVVMACICSVTLFGCAKEDIKEMEVKISVYNYDDETTETYTMSIDLYRHLTPNTVDAIVKYVNAGYYNNTVFYKMADYSRQIMVGDLLFTADEMENAGFSLNAEKPAIEGEFKYGGTTGSNLTAKKGSIGLWRSWYAHDNGYSDNRNGTDSGRATWFIPTESISSYNDYFCIFAQYDTSDDDNKDAIAAITEALSDSDYYVEYEIYYTGEYDNLTFHCVEKEDFVEDDIEDLFKAEGAELMCYNHYTVRVPMNGGNVAAKIVSAKIVD